MTKTLTVFTPTYNRGYIIGKLYESLCAQTCDDFIWLIVDDGSTDNTAELIRGFKNEGRLDIRYLRQRNSGKAIAHNTGVEACNTELFFCVDSDDTVPPDAVASILRLWERRRDDPNIAGIIAMRGSDTTTPLGTAFPDGLETTTMWDLYYKLHHRGDTALIYRTGILRDYPFWVAPGEKFMAETYVYHQIDQRYHLAVLDKIVWITKYLPDGYTYSVRKVTRESPVSYMTLKRMYVDYADSFSLKLENAALCLVGAHFAGRFREAFKGLPGHALALLATPMAWVLWHTAFKEKGAS